MRLSVVGALPPVLCAPFDDEDDFDDVAAGVPVLHGLRQERADESREAWD